MSRPARTGALGRKGRARAVQATASASTSRSTRNFTGGASCGSAASCVRTHASGLGILPRLRGEREAEIKLSPSTLGSGCCSTKGSIGYLVVVVGAVDPVENSCNCRSPTLSSSPAGVDRGGGKRHVLWFASRVV